jgi:hypothetical protein
MTRILKLQGFDDANQVTLTPREHKLPRIGLISCYNVLDRTGIDVSQIKPLMMFGSHAAQPRYPIPEDAMLVFNEISNQDIHKTALRRAARFCERAGLPVINPPKKVQHFTRDRVSETLQGIPGVTMPETCCFQPRSPQDIFDQATKIGLGFPFMIQFAGDHAAGKTTLIRSAYDERYLHQYVFGDKDYYLTEFLDYQDNSGLFRKQRIIFIGGEPLAHDELFDKQWSVTAASRAFMLEHPEHGLEVELVRKLVDETLRRIRPALLEIGRRIELDYFGLDCHIGADGHILVFQASANMNFLYRDAPGLEPQLAPIRDRLRKLISRNALTK